MNRNQNAHRSALTHVKADSRAVQARRAVTNTRPQWTWITGYDEAVAACLAILQGKPGLYPVFGIQLHVESREGKEENFPILVYTDAKYGNEGQNLCGNIRPGYWVGVSFLLCNPKKVTFKNVQDELLMLTLWAQPEMQEALAMYFEEKDHEQQMQDNAQRELLNTLRRRVMPSVAKAKPEEKSEPVAKKPKVKIDYPPFEKLSDIFNNSIGVFKHHSGVTIKVCESKYGLVVRASACRDEEHPVFGFAKHNQMVQQKVIKGVEFIPYEGENFVQEKQNFVDWLCKQLESEEVSEASPVIVAEAVTSASQQPVEVSSPPVIPAATMSVEAVLGLAATNGVIEGAKSGIPAKRTSKPRAKKTPCEAMPA